MQNISVYVVLNKNRNETAVYIRLKVGFGSLYAWLRKAPLPLSLSTAVTVKAECRYHYDQITEMRRWRFVTSFFVLFLPRRIREMIYGNSKIVLSNLQSRYLNGIFFLWLYLLCLLSVLWLTFFQERNFLVFTFYILAYSYGELPQPISERKKTSEPDTQDAEADKTDQVLPSKSPVKSTQQTQIPQQLRFGRRTIVTLSKVIAF